MGAFRRAIVPFGIVASFVLCPVGAVRSETGDSQQAPAAQAVVVPDAAVGASVIHIDPRTGELRSSPAEGAPVDPSLVIPPDMRNALSTSSDGLVQVPHPGPAGGFMLDLHGRFRSVTAATIGADGIPVIQSLTGDPQSLDVGR
jgi:hypothetical protein